MAITVPNQATASFADTSSEQIITPTAGNWLVAVVTLKMTDNSGPQISVGDWARNLWTLAYSGKVSASANNTAAQILTQVWVAPAVSYGGWPNLGVYTYALYASIFDVASGNVNVFEVAGMANGFLSVDSVTVATASGATSLSITLPAPAGGADCLMVGCAGTDNASGTVSVSSAGWTSLTQVTITSPNAQLTSAWRESTASQTVSWSSTVSTNWAAVAVAIKQTGTAPPQPNANWPALEFQLGFGQNLSTPVSAVQWTTLPNRLMPFSTQRGLQYELGFVQSSPTDLTLRNDDGAFSPRAAGSGTAVANGTTTTLIVSNTDGNTINVSDFFQLKSGGALKETSVFQVVSKVSATNTTITFARADGTPGGALVATATNDTYSACPIDIYLPYRILASWSGVRYPVTVGWIERWPQTWTDQHWGVVQAVAIDVIATLTAADTSVMRGEILRRNPQSYWPMNDKAGATVAQNQSRVGTTTLTSTQSSKGSGTSGTANFGASTQQLATSGNPPNNKTSLIGDTGSSWFDQGETTAECNAGDGFALVGNAGNDTTFPSIANGVTIMGITFFVNTSALSTNLLGFVSVATYDPTIFAIRNSAGTHTELKLSLDHGASAFPNWKVIVWDKGTNATTATTSTYQMGGGDFELWGLTFNQTSWSAYGYTSGSVGVTASGSCNLNPGFGRINIGGEADSAANGFCLPGMYMHVAIFPRILTNGEFGDFYKAMTSGVFFSAGVNDAINRCLAFAKWNGARVLNSTSVLVGTNVVQSTVAEKIATLADYEGGVVFSDAAGQLQYRARGRAANQTSKATIGDRPDLGEIAFIGESGNFEVDFDPTYLYNIVSVSNTGTQTTWQINPSSTTFTSQNLASISKYGARTLGKTVALQSDSDASNLVNALLAKYSTPKQRVSSVLIDVVKSAQWAFALSVEVGDVVTFNRRPIGAPQISITCVVLNVTHTVDAPDKWELTLVLAPR